MGYHSHLDPRNLWLQRSLCSEVSHFLINEAWTPWRADVFFNCTSSLFVRLCWISISVSYESVPDLWRIFLGLVESSVSPGFVRLTKNFYTRSEAPPRLGFWYSATGLFSIFRYVWVFSDRNVTAGHFDATRLVFLVKKTDLFCSPVFSLYLFLSPFDSLPSVV